jgi:hypothetical protein
LQDNTKESMKIAPGYWRVSNRSLDIRPCVNNPEACEGGAVSGKLGIHYCKLHHRGPYCSLCVDDYYPDGDSCRSCDDVSPSSGLYAIILLAVLVLALFILYKKSTRFRKLASKLNSRSMIVKGKLVITFFQVVLLLPVVYLVAYPTSYMKFLSIFEALNINVVEIFQLARLRAIVGLPCQRCLLVHAAALHRLVVRCRGYVGFELSPQPQAKDQAVRESGVLVPHAPVLRVPVSYVLRVPSLPMRKLRRRVEAVAGGLLD